MKRILLAVLAVALLAGCTEVYQAGGDIDRNHDNTEQTGTPTGPSE